MDAICDGLVFYIQSAVIFCFILLFVVVGILKCYGKIIIDFPRQNRRTYLDLEETIDSSTPPSRPVKQTENDVQERNAEAKSLKEQLRQNIRSLQKETEGKESALKQLEEEKAQCERQKKENHSLQGRLGQEQERITSLRKTLKTELEAKEDALKRLSALMSSRLKDGNSNVTDLSDQTRPVKIGEQFSELYDNEWTDAYGAVENHFGEKGQDIKEHELILILLHILEDSFTICNDKANRQLTEINEEVMRISSTISDKPMKLPVDLMQRIKEERKLYATDRIPNCAEVLPHLKEDLLHRRDDVDFLDCDSVKTFVQECLKLCWLMVVQDPPIIMVLQTEAIAPANEIFKAYKKRGDRVDFVVWPALRLEKGGSLLMKGVAEFKD